MARLSDRTLAVLTRIADELHTRESLRVLFLETELEEEHEHVPGGNKSQMLRAVLFPARDQADSGDSNALASLLKFICVMLERGIRDPHHPWAAARLDELRKTLLGNGYDLRWEPTDPGGPSTPFRVEILPTDPTPVPLQQEISALEAELHDRGYEVAANHYKQAVNALNENRYESTNSQLRPMLEDLVIRLAVDHAGYVRQGRGNDGWPAVTHLVETTKRLPEKEGGRLLQGLWPMLHPRGPHPGMSDPDEARFRMQVVTATARFLLKRFPPGP